MPTRSNSYPVSVPLFWSARTSNGDTDQDASSILTAIHTRTDDGPTPGYRERIAAGLDASSNLYGVKDLYRLVPGRLAGRFVWEPFWNLPVDIFSSVGIHTPVLIPNISGNGLSAADNQARSKFYAHLQQAYQSFQTGTFVGELRETLHQLRSPAKALRNGVAEYLSTLKKRRKGSWRHRRRVLQETWLEYVYGWAPLFSDIDGAARALARINAQNIRSMRITGTGTASSYEQYPFMLTSGVPPPNVSCFIGIHESHSVRYKGAVRVSNNSDGSPPKLRELGLTLRDFVPTAWNLIPYSFLVDYFTNIGDILEAWSVNKGGISWLLSGTLSICETRPESLQINGYQTTPGFGEWKLDVSSPGYVVASRRAVTRLPIPEVPLPTLSFEIPGISSRKWLNIAALVAARRSITPYY